jgi:putative thiamine transport system substrate-binding protein
MPLRSCCSSCRFDLSRRKSLALLVAALAGTSWGQTGAAWSAIEAQARGHKVFFNAWGGSERTNAYIQWAAAEMSARFGFQVEHVKLADTPEVIKRVRSEKAAGRQTGGSADVVWINGENFLTMKREGLLFGPFAESLPNYRYVDVSDKPSTRTDFSEPVDGLEAPWGMAQFTLFADSKRVPNLPQSMAALADFARTHPGRLTYPRPPAFIGTTFMKQALLELNADRAALYLPVTPAAFASVTAPLWTYLNALHPHLWRAGKQFPQTPAAITQMMADGELLVALTFNPNEAANEIAAKRQPATVTSWQMAGGAVGNTHFLAIPFNSGAKQAAQVFINFLMSPEAQARKADIAIWGDPTVLAMNKLTAVERQRFGGPPQPGQVGKPAPVLLEPHGSWVEPLEREWLRLYGR